MQSENINTITANVVNKHGITYFFWNFFFSAIRPYWKFIIAQIMVAIIWSVDFVLRPYIIKTIVDIVSNASISDSVDLLICPTLCYLGIITAVFLTFRFYDWVTLAFRPNLIKHIGVILMAKLMNKSYGFFQRQFSGSLASKVSDVANGISNILSALIDQFFSSILALFLSMWSMYNVSPVLALVLVLWIIVFLVLSFKFAKTASELSRNAAQRRSNVVGLIVDILSNVFSVTIFVNKNHELKTLENTYQNFVHSNQSRDWFFIKMHSTQQISFIIYQILCFLCLLQGIKLNIITSGDFVLIMMLNISIINSLHSLSRNIHNFAESFGNVTQGLQTIYINEEDKESLVIDHKGSNNSLIIDKSVINFINVSFAYSTSNKPNTMHNKIFDNLSVAIPSKQKIGLVGYSGSGKTTFIKLLLGLFELTSGQILIDNQDISKISKESLHNSIGLIPQDIALFNRSIMENIRYGRICASDEEVIEASKKAKAHDFISGLPDAYGSLVGERGIKLSGGERQRIAIARAILKNPPILLLDEATNQLDSITEKWIQESLIRLIEGKTAIIIAHRLSTLLHLDRILVFDQGKIVQDGRHADLIKEIGLYKTLWDNQSHGFLPLTSIKGR